MILTLPDLLVIFPVHLELFSRLLHQTDYNCTMMNHAVPMLLSTPNRNHIYNFDFYISKEKNKIKLVEPRKNTIFCSIYHMVTSTIFFNCNFTFGTFLCISRNPIWCFRIIVTFFYPFLQIPAQYWIVPILTAFETKYMATFTCYRSRFNVNNFNRVCAIGRWTPTQ